MPDMNIDEYDSDHLKNKIITLIACVCVAMGPQLLYLAAWYPVSLLWLPAVTFKDWFIAGVVIFWGYIPFVPVLYGAVIWTILSPIIKGMFLIILGIKYLGNNLTEKK